MKNPSRYTYTKRLAELLVRDQYPNLPVCIVRPSIVTPAYQEPIPGWVDSLNGPIGIMASFVWHLSLDQISSRSLHNDRLLAAKA